MMMAALTRRVFSVHIRPLASTPTARTDSERWSTLRGQGAYVKAVQVVSLVLRNSLGCLLCAWIANFCYSLGDVFSLRSSRSQSIESLIVASLVWTNVLFCPIILLTQTSILAPLRFVAQPDRPAGAWLCIKKLARATYHYYVVSVMLLTALGLLIVYVMPARLRWLKLEFYVGTMVNHTYTAGIELATKRIYREETCKGQERHHRRSGMPSEPSSAIRATTTTTSSHVSFWRMYWQTAPKVLVTIFAGAYVQVASQSQFLSSRLELLAFAVVSIGVKLLIQELAKVYVLRRDIRHIRFMCVLLALPTVLIDTQVRVVLLLGGQRSSFAASGSLAMALCEVTMRGCKMWLIKRQIRQKRDAILRAATTLSSCLPSQNSSSTSRYERMTFAGENVTSLARFERWRQQLMDFHTAEVMVDMYAEYIAIGCSASALYFFSDHPKYIYSGKASSSSTCSFHVALVGFQVTLEVVVDYVSCTVEIACGVELNSARKFSSFLAFLFMTIAVLNINISSFLYLK